MSLRCICVLFLQKSSDMETLHHIRNLRITILRTDIITSAISHGTANDPFIIPATRPQNPERWMMYQGWAHTALSLCVKALRSVERHRAMHACSSNLLESLQIWQDMLYRKLWQDISAAQTGYPSCKKAMRSRSAVQKPTDLMEP